MWGCTSGRWCIGQRANLADPAGIIDNADAEIATDAAACTVLIILTDQM